jgi:hypothetical protein
MRFFDVLLSKTNAMAALHNVDLEGLFDERFE